MAWELEPTVGGYGSNIPMNGGGGGGGGFAAGDLFSGLGGGLGAMVNQDAQIANQPGNPSQLRNQMRQSAAQFLMQGGGLDNARDAAAGDKANLLSNMYGFDKFMDQNTLRARGSQNPYGLVGVNMSPEEYTQEYGNDFEMRKGPAWWRKALGLAAAGAATFFTGGAAAPFAGSIYGGIAGQGGWAPEHEG